MLITAIIILAIILFGALALGLLAYFLSRASGNKEKTADAAFGALGGAWLTGNCLFWTIIYAAVGVAALWLIVHIVQRFSSAPAGFAALQPELIQPLDFLGGQVRGKLTSAEAAKLMDAPVCVRGDTNDLESFFLCKIPEQYIPVSTVAEYLAALKKGYSPYTTADITIQAWFIQASAALRFMAAARPSRASLFDVSDLKRLPVSFLNWAGSDQREQLESDSRGGKTLLDYAAAGGTWPITGLTITNHTLQFRDESVEYYVRELARGDYDHDGYEDALVMVSTYYIEGSGRSYTPYWVTCTDARRRQLQLKDWE